MAEKRDAEACEERARFCLSIGDMFEKPSELDRCASALEAHGGDALAWLAAPDEAAR
jgi:hypothetical protein